MFKTRVTDLLGIKYPIIQGGMLWLSRAELVAAVSNAGGLGFISAHSFSTAEELREEIHKTKGLTGKPFGVNISMLPEFAVQDMMLTDRFIDVVVDEGVDVVETSGRSPEPHVSRLKEAGVKLIHKVPASPGARYARKAESAGVDAVAVVGFEAAGHPGMSDVTSLVAIPRTVDAVKIPVIAGGGICDARSFVAALALGAEGVMMGTRFVLTRECLAHPKVKERLLASDETSTMIIQRSIRNAARVLRSKAAERALEMEARGASLEELMSVINGQLGRRVWVEGDLHAGVIPCGQVISRIHEVIDVKEVIEGIIHGAEEVRIRLNNLFST